MLDTEDLDIKKYDYSPFLTEYPFLVPATKFLQFLDVSIDRIESTNIFDSILYDIFNELAGLVFGKKPSENNKREKETSYEVVRFYLTISVLKILDNLVITKLWIKKYTKDIDRRITNYINNKDINTTRLFYILFKYMVPNEEFKPNKVVINGSNIGLSWHMITYLDMVENVNSNDLEYAKLHLVNQTLVKGHVIIPAENTEDIILLIKWILQKKIFKMYESPVEFDVNNTYKLKKFVDTFIDKVIKDITTSTSNIAKNFIGKEESRKQLELKNQENAKTVIDIIKRIKENLVYEHIPDFPPCIEVILEKMLVRKKHLRHTENMLLATYLGKKNFSYEQALFVFSQAVNYNKGVTDAQLKALMVKKHYMPSSCVTLQSEHLCHADDICTKYKIKNPLVYKNEQEG